MWTNGQADMAKLVLAFLQISLVKKQKPHPVYTASDAASNAGLSYYEAILATTRIGWLEGRFLRRCLE
jgi:hypothetical protein